jgi:hypothetical protein
MDRFRITDGSPLQDVLYIESVIVERQEKIDRLTARGRGLSKSVLKLEAEVNLLEALLDRTRAELENRTNDD